jgi:hypothetical protein
LPFGAILTGPNNNEKATYFLFQEKKYFCLTCSLTFQADVAVLGPSGTRLMTSSHQEQVGAGFLSLRAEIPALWLRGRRNPQECFIKKKKNAKGHSDTTLGKTCSCGLPLREGILPLSVLALLAVLGPFSIESC